VKAYTPSAFEKEWIEAVEGGNEYACRFMVANGKRVKEWLTTLQVSRGLPDASHLVHLHVIAGVLLRAPVHLLWDLL